MDIVHNIYCLPNVNIYEPQSQMCFLYISALLIEPGIKLMNWNINFVLVLTTYIFKKVQICTRYNSTLLHCCVALAARRHCLLLVSCLLIFCRFNFPSGMINGFAKHRRLWKLWRQSVDHHPSSRRCTRFTSISRPTIMRQVVWAAFSSLSLHQITVHASNVKLWHVQCIFIL